MAAADAGARGITHLFNAMSQLQHRAPGVVGAALDHGGLWCGIIADGHHVHPAALANAIRAKRMPGRLFLVTDAMPTAGHEGDVFFLNGRKVTRRDGVLTLEDGTLAGSDLTMDEAVRFSAGRLDVSVEEALRMASLYPAQLLGFATRGRIAGGTGRTSFTSTTGCGPRGCGSGGSECRRPADEPSIAGMPYRSAPITPRIARAVVAGRSYSGGRRVPPMNTASLRQAMALEAASKAAK